MNMKTMTAAEAKNSFGRYLDAAQREPVVITKKNRPVAVTVSFQDAEDLWLIEQAKEAGESGFAGVEASEQALKVILDASN
jgi:prevent-host-death family protein